MSVIPLKHEGDNPTVVSTHQDFQKLGGVEGRTLLIEGLDPAQLNPQREDSNVSYDLRVGPRYKDHRTQVEKEIPKEGEIKLRPGSALIIRTEEYVHLPRSMYGAISPKVTLVQMGLPHTYSKVDPGYHGHLLVTLFNLGETVVKLKRLDRFCALTIFDVAPGAILYTKPGKSIPGELAKPPRLKSLFNWAMEHPNLIQAGAIFLLTVVNVVLFMLSCRHR